MKNYNFQIDAAYDGERQKKILHGDIRMTGSIHQHPQRTNQKEG